MKRADRIKFLKLRRRADALELRALAAEKELADVSTRLRSAESRLTTTASTSSTFGLMAFGAGGSGNSQGGSAGVAAAFGMTAEPRVRPWPDEQ